MRAHYRTAFIFSIFIFSLLPFGVHAEIRTIVFPVDAPASFRDDFRDPRDGGAREHLGNDVIAPKLTPLVSTVDGVVSYVVRPEASWGYSITIQDAKGFQYRYLHMNNDSPGTDDGRGGEEHAYTSGIERGAEVKAGQLIGWVGDSGNAESTVPHLHFEIRRPEDRKPINPYDSLVAAASRSLYASSINVGGNRTAEHASVGELGVEAAEYVFVAELREGLQGPAVQELQLRLKDEGFFTFYTTTKYFGPITKTALEKYQRANGVAPTGVVGADTRALLNREEGSREGTFRLEKNLFEGMEGEAALQVQFKLEALGYFSGALNSVFDSAVREAVRKFQVDYKLVPSGFVDQSTWAKINEVYAASGQPAAPLGDRALDVPYEFTLALVIGSEGEEVKMLQKELQGLYYFPETVSLTGYFGSITREAVQKFQCGNDIVCSGDEYSTGYGRVGPKTRAVLNTL